MEAAVKALKMGKSAGVDNIPAELVQAGGEAMIDILTAICNKIWKTGEWPTTWTQSLVITEENEILNRWIEYCSDLYNYETDGDPIVLDCPQIPDEEHHLFYEKRWKQQSKR